MKGCVEISPKLKSGIRRFLRSPFHKRLLLRATKIGHPAVDKVAEPLLKKFGGMVRYNSVKAFIGKQIKAIMASYGYKPLTQGKCKENSVFKSGIRYWK